MRPFFFSLLSLLLFSQSAYCQGLTTAGKVEIYAPLVNGSRPSTFRQSEASQNTADDQRKRPGFSDDDTSSTGRHFSNSASFSDPPTNDINRNRRLGEVAGHHECESQWAMAERMKLDGESQVDPEDVRINCENKVYSYYSMKCVLASDGTTVTCGDVHFKIFNQGSVMSALAHANTTSPPSKSKVNLTSCYPAVSQFKDLITCGDNKQSFILDNSASVTQANQRAAKPASTSVGNSAAAGAGGKGTR